MCGLVGCYEKEKLTELLELNASRGKGTFADSISNFSLMRKPEEFIDIYRNPKKEDLEKMDGDYFIGHQRAPTSGSITIHQPAIVDGYLWHNGVIPVEEDKWDTKELATKISGGKLEEVLENIKIGSFSCVYSYIDEKFNTYIKLFRNELAPLFIDNEASFSTTKFKGSEELPPYKIFDLDIEEGTIKEESFWKKAKPVYFGV